SIYNRRLSPSGYSPYFLLFGTQPPDEELAYHQYIREATDHEQKAWDEEHARLHAAPIARSYVNSMKVVRAKTRAYLQKKRRYSELMLQETRYFAYANEDTSLNLSTMVLGPFLRATLTTRIN
ncbi:hypothetical protein K3495_g15509, partial [Podosphaera aphanis]